MERVIEIKYYQHDGSCFECPFLSCDETENEICNIGLIENWKPSDKCPGPGKYRMTLEAMLHDSHGSMWFEKGDPPTADSPCKFVTFFDDVNGEVIFVTGGGEYRMPSAEFYEKFEKMDGKS